MRCCRTRLCVCRDNHQENLPHPHERRDAHVKLSKPVQATSERAKCLHTCPPVYPLVRSSSTSWVIAIADSTFYNTSQLQVLGHCYPFQGLFKKHKRGILEYRIALSAFDNDYIPSGEHSLVQYRSLCKDAHMRDMWTDTCGGILRSH